MSQCPQCGRTCTAGDRFCPMDGARLRPARSRRRLFGAITAASLLCIALAGANLLPWLLQYGAGRCTVSPVGLRLAQDEGGGRNQTQFALLLELRNNNPLPVSIERLDFTIALNGRRLGSGALAAGEPTHMPAYGAARLELPLETGLWDLLRAGSAVLMTPGLRCRVTGEAGLRLWRARVRYPFDIDRVDLPLL